jgi:hypothetical protein
MSRLRENLIVAAVVLGVAALSTWQVTSKTKRPGHDLFSQERPAALRGETKRDLDSEKAKITGEAPPRS